MKGNDMGLSVSGVNYSVPMFRANAVSDVNDSAPISRTNSVEAANKVAFRGELEHDTVELSTQGSELSKERKQSIAKSARKNAAGWSILGGVISTIYYATRSNKTIAEKYNLDVEKDKAFIKQIKNDQTIWTIPGAIGCGILGWIVAACIGKENIDVD